MGVTYKVGLGWNVPEANMSIVSPQPSCEGIKYTRVTYTASGAVVREGPYVELVWSSLGNAATYQSLLAQFGLSSATSSQVTVIIRDERWNAVRMNGIALLPTIGEEATWHDFFPRDVVIVVRNLVTAT